MKGLANEARKQMVNTKGMERSPSAAKAYHAEVASLDAKLALAQRNAPLERQALVIANARLHMMKAANPDMSKEEEKKVRNLALAEARTRTGAKKTQVDITPDEWKAIQAGAISSSKLKDILNNTDVDHVRQLATPKSPRLMTTTKTARARSMAASGYTQSEIADALGVSLTTLKNSIREGG
jgi:DNA-binding NarL/FixJ family response regulator